MNTASHRIEWIDLCKGLAICLVLLGHTLHTDISEVYIYGFHMPLFFMLSGLVLSPKKRSFSETLIRRFNSLILPYIFFYLMTYVYWILIERHFRSFDIEWWRPLIGLLWGGNYNSLMIHNGILWFLPCLFLVEMEYQLISYLKNTTLQILAVFLIALIGYNIKIILPWCLNISFIVLQFYYVGVRLRPIIRDSSLKSKNSKDNLVLLIIVTCLFGCLYAYIQHEFKVKVNLSLNHIDNVWLFQMVSYLGIFSIISLCRIWKPIMTKEIWLYLGINTMVIFALHQPLLRIVKFLTSRITTVYNPDSNIFHSIITDICVILLLLPIITYYNKYSDRIYRYFKLKINHGIDKDVIRNR